MQVHAANVSLYNLNIANTYGKVCYARLGIAPNTVLTCYAVAPLRTIMCERRAPVPIMFSR